MWMPSLLRSHLILFIKIWYFFSISHLWQYKPANSLAAIMSGRSVTSASSFPEGSVDLEILTAVFPFFFICSYRSGCFFVVVKLFCNTCG